MTYSLALQEIIRRALDEDLAGGDLTTRSTIERSTEAKAVAVAKSPLIVSGIELFGLTFRALDPGCRVEVLIADGEKAEIGDEIVRVEGNAQALLMAERCALNFLQQLSGTASLTAKYVKAAQGKARIVDTRKTIPGLRALQRQAVLDGGGLNHRDQLGSAVMIKDNHIVAAGGILPAVKRARAAAPHTTRIEVEVTNLIEVQEALDAGADILLLDNMSLPLLQEAIACGKGKAILEVSGGVTLEKIPELAGSGVDVISVGALTHSAPAADISLRLTLEGNAKHSVSSAETGTR
ncbi:MAG: carboxylating nicotinate-nucleotide diphosphorylase [Polyangiaceae bacterium]|nr:carboxylating nicotinate-nucleotide diphosphorylase [Polyangiaceae bacterium]